MKIFNVSSFQQLWSQILGSIFLSILSLTSLNFFPFFIQSETNLFMTKGKLIGLPKLYIDEIFEHLFFVIDDNLRKKKYSKFSRDTDTKINKINQL